MQQELIEMLEEIIPYVEVWHKEDQDVLDKAEALVEKAKNNAPAVQQGEQINKALGKLRAAQWCHPNEVERLIDEAIDALVAATPAPAQEFNKSVADAEIKAMYVESQGSDKGWLGIEGSYFIGGVVAARRQKKAPAPAQELGLTDEEIKHVCAGIYLSDHPQGSASYDVALARAIIAALRAKGNKL